MKVLLWGSGGNAWKYLYQKHQSYGYWSSQAHNYPLQLTIDVGLLGLLIFLLIITLTFITFIKNIKYQINRYYFIIFILILIHSIIDFDLSLSAIMLLLWTFFSWNTKVYDLENESTNKKSIY
jgi:O-antigen ligase